MTNAFEFDDAGPYGQNPIHFCRRADPTRTVFGKRPEAFRI
jgi:hypothetical protein